MYFRSDSVRRWVRVTRSNGRNPNLHGGETKSLRTKWFFFCFFFQKHLIGAICGPRWRWKRQWWRRRANRGRGRGTRVRYDLSSAHVRTYTCSSRGGTGIFIIIIVIILTRRCKTTPCTRATRPREEKPTAAIRLRYGPAGPAPY